MVTVIIYAAIFFGVVFIDQITKAVVDMHNCNIPVIGDVVKILNTRNSGAAFGMMSDEPFAMALFYTLTGLAVIALAVYFIIKKNYSKWLDVSLVLVGAGAIGNFIDRLAFKEVRDFIYVSFFANFNVADVAVSVGGIMLVFYFLFLDKEAIFKKQTLENEGNTQNENE